MFFTKKDIIKLTFKQIKDKNFVVSDKRINEVLMKIGEKYNINYKKIDLSQETIEVVFICQHKDTVFIINHVNNLLHGCITDVVDVKLKNLRGYK